MLSKIRRKERRKGGKREEKEAKKRKKRDTLLLSLPFPLFVLTFILRKHKVNWAAGATPEPGTGL